ncbi:MAG: major capsid protein, partial [Gammaproteobacteria bacterium]
MDFMNIFENDAFTLASMTSAIERVPTNPGTLGQLNLFNNHPIRNVSVGIEEREGTLNLIKTSKRGAPLEQGTGKKATMRYFGTTRIAKQDVILA